MTTNFLHKTANEEPEVGHAPVGERAKSARHLPKHLTASERPSNLNLVTQARKHVLFLNMAPSNMRGYASMFCLGFFVAAGFAVRMMSIGPMFMEQVLRGETPWIAVPFALLLFVCFVVFIACITAAIRGFRLDLLTPKDLPLVFNRRTRKVYRVIPDAPRRDFGTPWRIVTYWMTAFKPWPLVMVEYDWDCLEAEFTKETTLMGNVVTHFNYLQLYVKEHPSSQHVIGCLVLSSPMTTVEEEAMSLWEFIRRFMEENGPVMQPGDRPAPPSPRYPWESGQAVLPYLWPIPVACCVISGWIMWKDGYPVIDYLGLKSFGVFAMAFVGSFLTGAMCFNWLAFRLAPSVHLPETLLQGEGPPLDLHRLAAEAGHRPASA